MRLLAYWPIGLDLQVLDLAGQGVAMHPERIGGLAEVAVAAVDDFHDEAAVELARRILVVDAFLDHLGDQLVKQLVHAVTSSRPVSRRYASRYFARVFWTTSSGSDGTGGCLFH